MQKPTYLDKYFFDWELFDVILQGTSSLDSGTYVAPIDNRDQAYEFLEAYGFNQNDPVLKAELFGNFQEALQFIKRYFLKEGNPEGLDYSVPNFIHTITEISELLLIVSGKVEGMSIEDRLWGSIVLKVMHTILHVDKDLRYNYFQVIQQQIFDRFYKFIGRDGEDRITLKDPYTDEVIHLQDFQTKAKKRRDSIIIKLFHKKENVAEELFDRVGVRFVTNSIFDTLKVVKFLYENNIVMPHNLKPSRSLNTIINLQKFKKCYGTTVDMAIRNDLSEDRFVQALQREAAECFPEKLSKEILNNHSFKNYRSIQFTCRQMIRYRNPFMQNFSAVRKEALESLKENPDNEFVKKVCDLDTSSIARDIRFFYPFEVQVVDVENHKVNTEGEASHQKYKKAQLKSAIDRLFASLIAINS